MSAGAVKRWAKAPMTQEQKDRIALANREHAARRHGMTLEEYLTVPTKQLVDKYWAAVPPNKPEDKSAAEFAGVSLKHWRSLTRKERGKLTSRAKYVLKTQTNNPPRSRKA